MRNSNWKITFSRIRPNSNSNSFTYWVSGYQKALEAEAVKVARDKSRKRLKVTVFVTLTTLIALASVLALHHFGV